MLVWDGKNEPNERQRRNRGVLFDALSDLGKKYPKAAFESRFMFAKALVDLVDHEPDPFSRSLNAVEESE